LAEFEEFEKIFFLKKNLILNLKDIIKSFLKKININISGLEN